MKRSVAALAAALVVGLVAPASARPKPALPIGEWGLLDKGKPLCKRPYLRIESDTITQIFEEGNGRCKITSLKAKGKILDGQFDCKWDASVPIEYQETADGDGRSFSLVIKSPTHIIYNNEDCGLCPAKTSP